MGTALHNVAVVARHNWHLRLGVRWCPAALDSDPGYWSMKSLRNLVTNRSFIFTVVLYIGSLFVLSPRPEFSISEPLIELVIFGIAFPLLAWLATIRARPLTIRVHPTGVEMLALLAYVLALSVYLAFGPQAIDSWLPQDWIASDRTKFFVTLGKKLLVFVALPLAIFGLAWRYSVRDFGFQKAGLRELRRTHLPIVLVASCAVLVFNYFLVGAAAPLREGKFSILQLLAGIPLCFIWLTIEAGLVEEFFFRAFLQTRLSAWFRSEITGVVLMSLIFGLAHAPGFIFRHAGAVEVARRKSYCARCYGLFHCNPRDQRRFLWRHLGQNKKSFCDRSDTCCGRSVSESFRFREDLAVAQTSSLWANERLAWLLGRQDARRPHRQDVCATAVRISRRVRRIG